MAEPGDKLQRKLMGVRVGYVLTLVTCYFTTLFVLSQWGTVLPDKEIIEMLGNANPIVILDQEMAWSALQWIVGAIGVAIAGDTARPSGKKQAAFGVAATNGSAS